MTHTCISKGFKDAGNSPVPECSIPDWGAPAHSPHEACLHDLEGPRYLYKDG